MKKRVGKKAPKVYKTEAEREKDRKRALRQIAEGTRLREEAKRRREKKHLH